MRMEFLRDAHGVLRGCAWSFYAIRLRRSARYIAEFVNTIPGEFLVDVEYFYENRDEVVHERGYSS